METRFISDVSIGIHRHTWRERTEQIPMGPYPTNLCKTSVLYGTRLPLHPTRGRIAPRWTETCKSPTLARKLTLQLPCSTFLTLPIRPCEASTACLGTGMSYYGISISNRRGELASTHLATYPSLGKRLLRRSELPSSHIFPLVFVVRVV